MKIKEINRTANVAWSPKSQHPIYLAAGTAAQQLDATFSTSAALEIYHVDLASKEFDMPIVGTMPSEHRFHKLLWTDHGMESEDHPNGVICGGTDNGEVCILDAASILSGDHELATLHTLTDHTGPVQALDINKFQNNLLATGASDSEIFIWDLKNPATALTPGPKTAPPDQISCLSWNHQVQHILASSTQTGRVVVWDLRKSEPIIKVGDQSAMFHYKSIAWHPDVATQMLIGNEEDRYPVIQMWDLRFATSPMKVFEGHSRGVLSLAWCPQDSDLLMSCGKDNRILCWNPNTQAQNGEIIYELPTTAQWCSDVTWCPRNPGLISTTAFDGHITVSTLMGGSQQILQQQNSQISDSFGIQQDSFKPPESPAEVIIEPLKKPPKWMRPPCGARFSFGGKLISFGNFNEPGVPKQVQISQVVTETEFVKRSQELESALMAGQLIDFCEMKIVQERSEKETLLWQFLKSNFHSEPRMQFLDLLGYNPQELSQKISGLANGRESALNDSLGVNAAELAMKIEQLKAGEEDEDALFGSDTPLADQKTPRDDGSAAFDAIATGNISQENLEEEEYVKEKIEPFSISTSDDTDGLVCQALLTGNFEAAVDVCFNDKRMADGLLLAIAGGPDLFARTQKRYLAQAQSTVSKVISAVVNRDWKGIVENTIIDNWKEALSMLVTYSKAEEFSELCCVLGDRLEKEANDYDSAILCYVCAGDVERMVSCWTRSSDGSNPSPLTLQDLVEKVMVLKKSVESERYESESVHLAKQLSGYATLLSSQGSLQTAMVYLSTTNDQGVNVMKERVFKAHGNLPGYPPESPFQKVDIRPQQYNKPAQQKAATPTYGRTTFSPNPISPNQPSHVPNQFSPSAVNPPSYFNPASSMHNPVSIGHTSAYNPGQSHSNMYQAPTTTYSGPPPGQVPPLQPSYHTQPNYQPPQANFNQNPNPNSFYNPMANTNMHQPPVYNPAGNTSFNNQGPPHMPTMMQPTSHAQELTPPPPPGGTGHPMSMKAAKQEISPSTNHPQPMNFYNPGAAQPQLPGNTPPGTIPNSTMLPPRTSMPGQTNLPPQPPKKALEPPKPEVIKGPIPSEHMVLQQTFDAILDRCRNASNNPQTKRKIEDVKRKLEILYDLLRESRVSQNVLNGLHQMIQVCQQSDYMTGIQIHTHMITTGNFSEISSFMPGLKTLMQIAGQLKV